MTPAGNSCARARLRQVLGLIAAAAWLTLLVASPAAGRRAKPEKCAVETKPGKFQRPLTLGDVEPQLEILAGTKADPFVSERVFFGDIGMPRYDEVCRNSAVAYGSLKVAQTMMADAQENLVKYAKDHVARGEAKRQLKELKQETQVAEMAPPPGAEASAPPAAEPEPEPEWTAEEAALVIKQAKQQKGKFTADELAYFATMSANLGIAGYALGKGVQSEIELAQDIPNLLNHAREDFAGVNLLKLPFVLQNLNTARKQLMALPVEGKETATNLAKYAAILKELREETKDVTPVD